MFEPRPPHTFENRVDIDLITATPVEHPSSPLLRDTLQRGEISETPPALTQAERAVAVLIAEGARNHDVARQLGISHRTVETLLSNMFAKLGLGSRVELASWVSNSSQAAVDE